MRVSEVINRTMESKGRYNPLRLGRETIRTFTTKYTGWCEEHEGRTPGYEEVEKGYWGWMGFNSGSVPY